MSFKDGRIGVGKDPIFPLDISGSCRIDGDLILGGRFSDSQGNAIQLGSGSGAASTPDQTKVSLPSWNGGTITTQGLGIFKGKQDASKSSLYITGDTSLPSSATGTSNTTLGFGAGRYIGGSNNTFIGKQAGYNNTSSQNTFVGKESGYNSTSGYDNTGVGYESLYRLTTGAGNVAMGYYSLRSMTSSSHSIGIGNEAGMGIQGGQNICIGHYTGYNSASTNTGHNNVFIGQRVGYDITQGYENVSIGRQSGENLTTGNKNIFLGSKAGFSHSTGDDNTYIGYYAGYETTSGTLNTYVGAYAGRWYASRGNYNVAIGGYALAQGQGHNNVAIGYQSIYYGDNDGLIAIGYRANHQHHGIKSIAIGYEALYGSAGNLSTNDGQYSIAIGYQAGYTQVGGNYCTMIGTQSGYSLTTGYDNILIGNQSGYNMTTGYNNVIIGNEAGKASTTGQYNVLVGRQAGVFVTTSYNTFIGGQAGFYTSSGSDNTYIGFYAGYHGSGGYYNTFVGRNAGYGGSSRNGNYNTCIGYSSGYDLTTGAQNTLVGGYAGNNLTTGNDNVLIGYEAGMDMTDKTKCTFVGYKAGRSTSQEANTAIGHEALYTNINGLFNTAIGYRSCYGGSSGHSNVGVGIYTLHGKTTAGENTAIGTNSQRLITSGNYNVSLGRSSCYNNTTGDHNISIGSNTGPKSSDTGLSHRLYIGNMPDANGANRGVDSYIYGYMKTDDNPYLALNAKMVIGGNTFDRSDTSLEVKGGNLLVRSDGTNVDGSILIRGGGGHTSYFYTLYNGDCKINSYARYAPILLNSGSGREGYKIGMYDKAPTDPTMNDSTLGNPYGKLYVQGGHVGTEPAANTDVQSAAIVIGAYGGSTWNTNKYGGFLAFTQPYWSGNTTQQVPGGWIACKKSAGNGSYGWGMAFGTTANHGHNYSEKMLLTQSGWLSIDGTYQSSDDRIKHNETIIENALETLNQLEGKVYFKTHEMYEPNHDFNLDISGEPIDESGNLIDYTMESGFIAQSVLKIDKLKHLVTGGDEYVEETTIKEDLSGNPILDNSGNTIIDEVKTVLHKKRHILNYCGLIPWNTEGIKELYKENQDQNVKILDLYKENQSLKARLAKIEAFLGL